MPLLLLAVALSQLLGHSPSTMSSADPFELSTLKWSHRPLLVFAPGAQAELYQEQVRLLAPEAIRAGLVDRDMVVLHLLSEGESVLVRPAEEGEKKRQLLTVEAMAALRERFDVPDGTFATILVGKDGTEKRRDRTTVHPERLFSTIDAMPMRQREMRTDDNGG